MSEFDDILKCLSYFSGKILSLVRNRQCHLHETIQIRVRLQVLQHYPHYWRGKWRNELIILQSPTYPIEFTILFQKFAFNQSIRIKLFLFDHESVSLVVIVTTFSFVRFINISIGFINISWLLVLLCTSCLQIPFRSNFNQCRHHVLKSTQIDSNILK